MIVFRILGLVMALPLAASAVFFVDNDEYIRRVWLDEFTGFDRRIIVSHLPRYPDLAPRQAAPEDTKSAILAWKGVHPRFLELSEPDQVSRIESLLRKERSGYPTPALFELRKTTAFPQSHELEVHRVQEDRRLGLAGGSVLLIVLVVQGMISILAWLANTFCRNDGDCRRSGHPGAIVGISRYGATRVSGRQP